MESKQALSEVVATEPVDNGQSVAASVELDFASEMRQQNSEMREQMSEMRQQMQEQNSAVRQQFSELTHQMSLQSRQFHSMLSTLMLQGEEHQQMTSKQQHRYMQQATTAEHQALMDDTWQSVQLAGVTGIGEQQPAYDDTKHSVAMSHPISTKQSIVEQTRMS
jgi:flagellar biosynthesis GTPase FlhF